MNVNYEYYRTFYYVAKYNSFTKAANVLCSNQPNVTRSMNRLEEELGCRLFERNNRGVTLTPEGERLFGHVAVAQEQLQQAEEELSGSAALERGSITIGASETALHLFLPEKFKRFHAKFPGIRLRIVNYSTPQALAALKQGMVDLIVVTTPTRAEKPIREVVLSSFQETLIGGKSFAPLSGTPLHLRELQNYPLICLGRDTTTYDFYSRLFFRYDLALQPDTEVATTDQVLQLVQCELGLGFLPEPFARGAISRGEVCHIPLIEPIPPRQISLLWDGRRPLSMAAREFEKELCSTAPAGRAAGKDAEL